MADEKQVVESPVLEQQTTKPKEASASEKPPGEIDYTDLVSQLEKAGVTNQKQLEGKLQAASERGHLANLLGEMKSENAELKRMIMEMNASQKKRSTSSYDDDDGKQAGAIDIGDLIGKKVRDVIQQEKQEALAAQTRAWQAWQEIQQDEDYHLVKDEWEGKMRDPNFAIQLQAGSIDPQREYRELVRQTYKKAVRRSAEVIKTLTSGSAPPKVHVEDSARVGGNTRPEPKPKDKALGALRDKLKSGAVLTEDEELAALQAVLMGGAGT